MSKIEFTRVTSVETRDGRVFISVQPPRPGVEYRDIPVLQLFPGAMVTPSEDDIVAVHTLPDGMKVATMASDPPDGVTMPTLGEGELAFRFSDGTEIRIQQGASGYTVDIAGDDVVTVKSGNKVVVESPEVYLGDETGAQPVARKGDPISGTDSSGGSVSGQIDDGSTSVNSA